MIWLSKEKRRKKKRGRVWLAWKQDRNWFGKFERACLFVVIVWHGRVTWAWTYYSTVSSYSEGLECIGKGESRGIGEFGCDGNVKKRILKTNPIRCSAKRVTELFLPTNATRSFVPREKKWWRKSETVEILRLIYIKRWFGEKSSHVHFDRGLEIEWIVWKWPLFVEEH